MVKIVLFIISILVKAKPIGKTKNEDNCCILFFLLFERLLSVSSEDISKLPIYSIELNRFNQNEFVIAGMDPYIRVYDRRYIDNTQTKPLKSFCPDSIVRFR